MPTHQYIPVQGGDMWVKASANSQVQLLLGADGQAVLATDWLGLSERAALRLIAMSPSALRNCAPTTNCTLTNDWPKATFDWPHCMPDIMFRQNNQMDVTTAQAAR